MAVKRAENIIIVDLNAEIDSGWKDGTLVVSLEDDKFYRMESGSAVEISAGGGGGVSDAQLMYRSETTAVTKAKEGLTMIVEKIV